MYLHKGCLSELLEQAITTLLLSSVQHAEAAMCCASYAKLYPAVRIIGSNLCNSGAHGAANVASLPLHCCTQADPYGHTAVVRRAPLVQGAPQGQRHQQVLPAGPALGSKGLAAHLTFDMLAQYRVTSRSAGLLTSGETVSSRWSLLT